MGELVTLTAAFTAAVSPYEMIPLVFQFVILSPSVPLFTVIEFFTIFFAIRSASTADFCAAVMSENAISLYVVVAVVVTFVVVFLPALSVAVVVTTVTVVVVLPLVVVVVVVSAKAGCAAKRKLKTNKRKKSRSSLRSPAGIFLFIFLPFLHTGKGRLPGRSVQSSLIRIVNLILLCIPIFVIIAGAYWQNVNL